MPQTGKFDSRTSEEYEKKFINKESPTDQGYVPNADLPVEPPVPNPTPRPTPTPNPNPNPTPDPNIPVNRNGNTSPNTNPSPTPEPSPTPSPRTGGSSSVSTAPAPTPIESFTSVLKRCQEWWKGTDFKADPEDCPYFVYGCTDRWATNHNPKAHYDHDPNSCLYDSAFTEDAWNNLYRNEFYNNHTEGYTRREWRDLYDN